MINDLKAQLEAKNLTIKNLKNRLAEMRDICNEVKTKHDNNVIATNNAELDHKVTELFKENESLKIHCKELSDTIKESKTKNVEQITSLIAKNDEFKAQL